MSKIEYGPLSWLKSRKQKRTKLEMFCAVEHPEPIGGDVSNGRMDGKSSFTIPAIVRFLADTEGFKQRCAGYANYLVKISNR